MDSMKLMTVLLLVVVLLCQIHSVECRPNCGARWNPGCPKKIKHKVKFYSNFREEEFIMMIRFMNQMKNCLTLVVPLIFEKKTKKTKKNLKL